MQVAALHRAGALGEGGQGIRRGGSQRGCAHAVAKGIGLSRKGMGIGHGAGLSVRGGVAVQIPLLDLGKRPGGGQRRHAGKTLTIGLAGFGRRKGIHGRTGPGGIHLLKAIRYRDGFEGIGGFLRLLLGGFLEGIEIAVLIPPIVHARTSSNDIGNLIISCSGACVNQIQSKPDIWCSPVAGSGTDCDQTANFVVECDISARRD